MVQTERERHSEAEKSAAQKLLANDKRLWLSQEEALAQLKAEADRRHAQAMYEAGRKAADTERELRRQLEDMRAQVESKRASAASSVISSGLKSQLSHMQSENAQLRRNLLDAQASKMVPDADDGDWRPKAAAIPIASSSTPRPKAGAQHFKIG